MIPGDKFSEKVNEALEKCQEFDNKCYNDVTAASKGVWVQTDPAIEARQFGLLLGLGIWVALTIAVLAPQLNKQMHPLKVNQGAYIPKAQVSSFSALVPGATVTLSGDGSAIATITQAPPVTSVQA